MTRGRGLTRVRRCLPTGDTHNQREDRELAARPAQGVCVPTEVIETAQADSVMQWFRAAALALACCATALGACQDQLSSQQCKSVKSRCAQSAIAQKCCATCKAAGETHATSANARLACTRAAVWASRQDQVGCTGIYRVHSLAARRTDLVNAD